MLHPGKLCIDCRHLVMGKNGEVSLAKVKRYDRPQMRVHSYRRCKSIGLRLKRVIYYASLRMAADKMGVNRSTARRMIDGLADNRRHGYELIEVTEREYNQNWELHYDPDASK